MQHNMMINHDCPNTFDKWQSVDYKNLLLAHG